MNKVGYVRIASPENTWESLLSRQEEKNPTNAVRPQKQARTNGRPSAAAPRQPLTNKAAKDRHREAGFPAQVACAAPISLCPAEQSTVYFGGCQIHTFNASLPYVTRTGWQRSLCCYHVLRHRAAPLARLVTLNPQDHSGGKPAPASRGGHRVLSSQVSSHTGAHDTTMQPLQTLPAPLSRKAELRA